MFWNKWITWNTTYKEVSETFYFFFLGFFAVAAALFFSSSSGENVGELGE